MIFMVDCKQCMTKFTALSKTQLFCSKSCASKFKNIITLQKRLMAYKENPKFCQQCGSILTYEKSKTNKFCSSSCSATYTNLSRPIRSHLVNKKISNKLKGRTQTAEHVRNSQSARKRNFRIKICSVCKICGKSTNTKSRVTCSSLCFSINQQRNALIQEQHGGGHKGRYKDFRCDSTWELAFLIYHLDHNIDIKRSENVYSYEHNGKIHKYNPDFIVNEIEIEIKGYMCERAKSKLRQYPHITVIDKKSIKPYIYYVKERYGIADLRCLYEA